MKRRHYSRQHPGLATNTRPQALTMPSPNGATVNSQACKRLEKGCKRLENIADLNPAPTGRQCPHGSGCDPGYGQ